MAKYKDLDELRGFDHGLSYVTGVSDLNPWALRYMMRPHQFAGNSWWRSYNDTVEMIKESFIESHEVIDIDGARVKFEGGWALVRASNTQPGAELLGEQVLAHE